MESGRTDRLSDITEIDRGLPDSGIMPPGELPDGSSDLAAAADRWTRRSGEVLVLVADEPQVDHRQAPAESLPGDDVVEGAEGDDGSGAACRIREARVVDGAECERQPACQDRAEHRLVVAPELLPDAGDSRQCLGDA